MGVSFAQAYSLDDPSAGVYANNNFTYMLDYMLWEASLNNRSVHFYPETAYWVNVSQYASIRESRLLMAEWMT